jgi:pimeloyl-ACP methyl ester carboxylesterase
MTGYAQVNGLDMYYEVHGTGRPLVLIHGGMSAIGTSFGQLLPGLAKNRQVIAVELQAHGHTADIDRTFSVANLASDIVALLGHLGIGNADFFGYSIGAAVAMQVSIDHPELVGRQVLASISYTRAGMHPELAGGMEQMQPEHMVGSPFHEEYLRIAPRPEDFGRTLDRVKELDRDNPDWPADAIRSIQAPTLLLYGDSDIIRPEHAVEIFRLLGGGVAGDLAGLPKSQLAILPGTTHITLVHKADWVVSMVEAFLG